MMQKNKYGQYFTPQFMAEFMVSLLTCAKESTILEPSSGKGVFLEALEQAGYFHWTAYEIDSTLILNTRVINDSFVSVEIPQLFDAVIGNPPYIRWRNLEDNLKEELLGSSLWNSLFNSLCDYLFFFIARSILLLREGGELIFICSDYWLNSTNGSTLREFILEQGSIESIYHYREANIFSGVTASFMVFKFVKAARRAQIQLCTYIGERNVNLSRLRDSKNYEIRDIPSFQPDERWILATEDQQQGVRSLERACSRGHKVLFGEQSIIHRIGDFFYIGNGLVSGLDKAFNLTAIQADLSPQEQKKTIKVVKAKDIQPYSYSMVSTYAYIEDKELFEEELTTQYPMIHKAIFPYRDALQRRYQYGRTIDYWSFTFPRNKTLFDADVRRILVPSKDRISKRQYFRFCLAPQGIYPLQDVTGIVPKKHCKESLEYVVAYLNSSQVFDWLSLNGIVKGKVVEFSEAPLASIPYRSIDWDDANEVALHNQITSLVQESMGAGKAVPKEQINKLITELV